MINHDYPHGSRGDNADKDAMSVKLYAKIDTGALTVVRVRPICVYRLFCITKDGGGVRGIVDCSHPMAESVNNYTDEMAVRFSYNSVDNVVHA